VTKRILITGSSRGIGKTIALRIADNDYDIVVHCRSQIEAAEETANAIRMKGRKVSVLQFDVLDREQSKADIEADIEANGPYYGVICNAGINRDNAFPAMSSQDWDDVIDTALKGFYNVVHPTVMPMVQNREGGRIVTLSSVSGIAGNRGQVNYSAAKAGIIGATKSLALELAKRKITVNCVAPGVIESDMTAELNMDHILKMVPLRRAGSQSEVAGLVNFLISDEAAYITRQVISVNGGLV